MREKCPKCKDYGLNYDPRRRAARCYYVGCDFYQAVQDEKEYYMRFVFTEDNWENYCGRTPKNIRKISGQMTREHALGSI